MTCQGWLAKFYCIVFNLSLLPRFPTIPIYQNRNLTYNIHDSHILKETFLTRKAHQAINVPLLKGLLLMYYVQTEIQNDSDKKSTNPRKLSSQQPSHADGNGAIIGFVASH